MTPAACKAARSLVGLSQFELAVKSGVSIGTISGWENGRTGLRPANVAAIVGAFERVGVVIAPSGHVTLRTPRRLPQAAAAD